MDLVEFLRARVADDERAVVAILRRAPNWSVDSEPWMTNGVGVIDDRGDSVAVAIGDYAARHVARHDPARVLRDVEARRLLLDDIKRDLADDPTDESALWRAAVMAAPYADHPDYREEWAPGSVA